ncbi:ABC transporter permease [Halococcus qingdaonensis]|uniref:ABC transporter permease n=1 Tax=Halococcus qingdaonensis TaxID=224402 RepID=UPI002115EBFE|nr:ABC transporter permease [Halococcus qingdaonensis]
MSGVVSFFDSLVQFTADNSDRLLRLFGEHIILAVETLVIALPIAIVLGIAISYNERAATVVLWIASILLTIPSIAFFGMLVPILGIGTPPVIVALVAYSQLPVIRNTYLGVTGVDPAAIEAGTGLGMNRFERLWRVRLPVALPVVMAGVRNAVVLLVGLAAIGAFIGGPGLGFFIFYGINQGNTAMIVVATVLVSVLALAFDYLFAVTERGLRLRNGEDLEPTYTTRLLDAIRTQLQ